jgi:uncharacterized membrane protein (DUF373 family)
LRKLLKQVRQAFQDESFLQYVRYVESFVSKVLSIGMVIVILVAVYDLGLFLLAELFTTPIARFSTTFFTIFGLFLNVLIALEILENITAYLKKHVIQVELVISTSLIAVSRKIIILDLEKTSGTDLIALAAAIFSLSISYWIIKRINWRSPDQ